MDVLTFIAEITKALAWPFAAITLIFLLRKPLLELVPLMRKLKYKEMELEFSQGIMETKAEVAESTEIPPKKSAEAQVKSEHLAQIAAYSTRVAVMEAWIELETAAAEVASSFWQTSNTDVMKKNVNLAEYLYKCGVIGPKQVSTFNMLRKLRNQVAHAREIDLSEKDVLSYIDLASNLSIFLRSKA
ncbi:MAG: hypothetical protein JXR04_05580 [Bermanella sp.]